MHGTHAHTQQPLHEGLVSQEDARGGEDATTLVILYGFQEEHLARA
jgi:hypothetical protein